MLAPTVQNQMEKNMENEMDKVVIYHYSNMA